jgi:hypothetical protein
MLEVLTLFWPCSSHIPIFIPVILQKYGYFTLVMLKQITYELEPVFRRTADLIYCAIYQNTMVYEFATNITGR